MWSSSGSMCNPNGERGRRYYALDVLRGLSIVLMVFYHWGYDLVLYGLIPAWVLYNPLLDALQLLFASVFVAISGASSTFSHSNVRRGLRILACALVVSAVTFWFDPQEAIRFGILHFLGTAALLYTLLAPVLRRFPPNPVPVPCAVLPDPGADTALLSGPWPLVAGFPPAGVFLGGLLPLAALVFYGTFSACG